ncbi:ECF sigma factor [Symmachiella dynata]|uniref:RNA polymerase sigma factor n=1 Tax=Symmachiella dynata TaxID=2527995 RepID=UPI0011898FCD|nr:sigma-70 family RNA polymerase sigma factor [Symmachiella dynata]QDT48978.1 ECF sigma factor [Symmachiella dynata]
MTEEQTFRILLDQLRAGDEVAAVKIVQDHTAGLVAVARRQMGAGLARRVDPEDILQSVYRSLFVRVQQGEFELGAGRDLWQLLVTMTLNKVRRSAKYHGAGKRDMSKDQSVRADADPLDHIPGSGEPGPEEAAMLVDETEAFLKTLKPQDRPIVELRLQGYNSIEIAEQTGRAERSVRRILKQIQERLTEATRSDVS